MNNISKRKTHFGGNELEERLRIEEQEEKGAQDTFKQLQDSVTTPDLTICANLQL